MSTEQLNEVTLCLIWCTMDMEQKDHVIHIRHTQWQSSNLCVTTIGNCNIHELLDIANDILNDILSKEIMDIYW